MNAFDFESDLKDLWANHKLLLVLLIIPILLYKFRSIFIGMLVSDSSAILAETVKKDEALKQSQTVASAKADQIIADADKARKEAESKPVNEDWNKK